MKTTVKDTPAGPVIVVAELQAVDDDAEFDIDVEIKAKFEVCWRCRGKGSHVNPSVDGHGITREEMDELGPEFFEDYMSGVYDVSCHECHGRRVLAVPDPKNNPPELLERYERELRWDADYAAEREAERRMGA